MPGVDQPRTLPLIAIAMAWQTDEDTPAAEAGAQIFAIRNSTFDPGVGSVQPLGTTGSQFPKDSHRNVSREPQATLVVYASLHQAPLLLESLFKGQPTVVDAELDPEALRRWREEFPALQDVRPELIGSIKLDTSEQRFA